VTHAVEAFAAIAPRVDSEEIVDADALHLAVFALVGRRITVVAPASGAALRVAVVGAEGAKKGVLRRFLLHSHLNPTK